MEIYQKSRQLEVLNFRLLPYPFPPNSLPLPHLLTQIYTRHARQIHFVALSLSKFGVGECSNLSHPLGNTGNIEQSGLKKHLITLTIAGKLDCAAGSKVHQWLLWEAVGRLRCIGNTHFGNLDLLCCFCY
jgi:hypothetical protein